MSNEVRKYRDRLIAATAKQLVETAEACSDDRRLMEVEFERVLKIAFQACEEEANRDRRSP